MRRRGAYVAGALMAALALSAPAPADAGVRAGVAAVDASWHVGASAGQYASDGTFVDHYEGTFDPTAHSVRRRSSYGVQSRLSVRALVVEGPDGQRVAVVKNDLYIPQHLLYRRAAQLMADRGECGIGPETFTMATTHNHSSPFYSSTAWGVWAFQDVFDIRFFDYMAKRMLEAVERACADLRPVRVGAAVSELTGVARSSFGPTLADDGTPAGYPHPHTDPDLTVIRFDDVTDPANPRPLANLLNYSLHPELLEGNDLISADYLGPLERMLDRETGAVTVFTQGAVGTAEPERSTHHPVEARREFFHKDYAQAEVVARMIADAAVTTWRDIERATPEQPERFVAFPAEGQSRFPVRMADRWYPGPFSHPYPGVSNCRTQPALELDPRLPIVGLPDCVPLSQSLAQLGGPELPIDELPFDPGISTAELKALGIPVPDNLSAPSYTGLAEDLNVHLQGIRLGPIFLPVCSCEQWYDQSLNIKTRTDRVPGNQWNGFDWSERCSLGSGEHEGAFVCPDPRDPSAEPLAISPERFERMRAQVRNPANGWNELENLLEAESEPLDAAEIRGNYTHDDGCGPDPLTPGPGHCGPGGRSASAELGYRLTVPISMANDYNGYIATYREYQRGDHYRKALTGWGPRSSDYMASRLVHIGRELNDARVAVPTDMQEEELMRPKVTADLALNDVRARAVGEVGEAAIRAFEAVLPDDGGEARVVTEPRNTQRFSAAFFTWNGGSNFTDSPEVRVERRVTDGQGRGRWRGYADQSGEVVTTVSFPQLTEAAHYLLGGQEWHWSAWFEAFVSPFDTGERPLATPEGRYRFVAEGERREGGSVVPYRVASEPFEVRAWRGITVERLRVTPAGRVGFAVGPRSRYTVGPGGDDVDVVGEGETIRASVGPIDYPDSYGTPVRFIEERRTAYRHPAAPNDPRRLEWYCFTCTFRPWIDAGDAERARVTVVRPDGRRARVRAVPKGDGRWATERRIPPGSRAGVRRGHVRDLHGNRNGERSAVVVRAGG